jgi:RNA polymerase sigma-70 factor (ECF subfamily)
VTELEPSQLDQAAREESELALDHPARALDRRELAGVIGEAMQKLSEKHRAIIVLREIEGLSYQEMAEVLKISKGTVMSRLFHARRNLQQLLRPYLEEDSDRGSNLRLAPQGA